LLAQLRGLKAPKEVIDKYLRKTDFELWEEHLIPWQVIMLMSPADMYYREHQSGKKVFMKFAGFKSTALAAIMQLTKVKKAGRILQEIRLIEYGALTNG